MVDGGRHVFGRKMGVRREKRMRHQSETGDVGALEFPLSQVAKIRKLPVE